MAINALVEQMYQEGVGFIDVWGYFIGKENMYMRDGLHLSGSKGRSSVLREPAQTVEQVLTI